MANTNNYISHIRNRRTRKKTSTGYEKLNDLLNGGFSSELITLGAIPSLGKTTFMLQLADNMARIDNTKVLFLSLEMTEDDLITKSLSRLSYLSDEINDYNYNDIMYNCNDEELNKMVELYEPISNNLTIIDNLYDIRDINTCINEFREENKENKVIVIIDYLQYISCNANLNDKQIMDLIIKDLKSLSKNLDITIVAISSINRFNYSNGITLDSFKESGSIEYTNDILLGIEFTNSSDYEDMGAKRPIRKITLKILKNRYGKLGKVNFDFITEYNTFIEK